ncbi:MAG: tRNA (adenosine(37)-N6)-threonylcarbamoyltransferase complex dimerization subunit type 1 TsaB [Amaricoccus sp.]
MPADGALILAFDTSAAQCAAALVRGGRLLDEAVEPMARGQAERLLPMLEALLAGAGLGWAELDRIAVGTGPGNFTGLRIAVAAARGLALALGRPAVGVTRFEALAFGQAGLVEVGLEDGRGRLFLQRFRDGRAEAPPAETVPPAGPDLLCLGHGAQARARVAGCRAGSEAVAAGPLRLAEVAAAAPALAPPAPLYLRPADAAAPSEAPTRILDDT